MSFRVLETPQGLGSALQEVEKEKYKQVYFDQVDGAIPVFIGYTESRSFVCGLDTMKAIEVHSIVDFEKHFGKGPQFQLESIQLIQHKQSTGMDCHDVELSEASIFYLYETVKLYFKNGGERCYVISIGEYSEPFLKEVFYKGIDCAVAVTEADFICLPDASRLAKLNRVEDFTDVQRYCLNRVNRSKDRIFLLDWHPSSEVLKTHSLTTGCTDENDESDLSYAAAYYPWVVSEECHVVKYDDVCEKLKISGKNIAFNQICEKKAKPISTQLNALIREKRLLTRSMTTLESKEINWCSHFSVLVSRLNRLLCSSSSSSQRACVDAMMTVQRFLYSGFFHLFHLWLLPKNRSHRQEPTVFSNTSSSNALPSNTLSQHSYAVHYAEQRKSSKSKSQSKSKVRWIQGRKSECEFLSSVILNELREDLNDSLRRLKQTSHHFLSALQAGHAGADVEEIEKQLVSSQSWICDKTVIPFWETTREDDINKHINKFRDIQRDIQKHKQRALEDSASPMNLHSFMKSAVADFVTLFNQINLAYCRLRRRLYSAIDALEQQLVEESLLYRTILQRSQQVFATLPPCGGVAGAYRMFDRRHGVWRSPGGIAIQGVKNISETDFFIRSSDHQAWLALQTPCRSPVQEPALQVQRVQTQRVQTKLAGQKKVSFNSIRCVSDSTSDETSVSCSLSNSDPSFDGKNNDSISNKKRIIVWGSSMMGVSPVDPVNLSAQRVLLSVRRWFYQSQKKPDFLKNFLDQVTYYLRSLWCLGALQGRTESQAFYIDYKYPSTSSLPSEGIHDASIVIGMAIKEPGAFNKVFLPYSVKT